MAVVWGTVKDHKGYIEIADNQDKGTTITLYFPVTRAGTQPNKAAFSIDDYRGHGEKIIVVDDVAEQREIAREILTRRGLSGDRAKKR